MKKVMRTGVMIVALFATTMNFATEVVNAAEFKNENSTMVTLKKIEIGDQVVVKNRFGSVVMNDIAISALNYQQVLNLSSLDDGTYTLEVIKATEINITPFLVSQGKVVLKFDQEYTLFKPMVRTKDNLLFISQLSLAKNPLEIELYFNSSQDGGNYYKLVHSETINAEMIIGRVLELNKKEFGKYKLILSTEGRKFTEKFRI